MGLLDRLERSAPRAGSYGEWDDFWYKPVDAWANTFAGFPMSPDLSMRVSAVFACTSLLAEVIASLPCVLYRRLDRGGKEKAREHRWYKAVRRKPNRRQTRIDYFGMQQMHLGLRAAAIAEIRDDGQTAELLPVHPELVTRELLPSGLFRYEIRDPKGGAPRTLLQNRILDVRDLSLDGLTGLARASLAREAIAVAAAAEGYVGRFFKYDATGRLVLTHPTALDETQRAEWRKTIAENAEGWANRSKTMFLHSGVTAAELGKHDDSGFIIDPRRFQVADIARFWRVPLFMIGLEEKSTTWGSGLEQQKQGFVDFTIKSWADRHTEAMNLALLDEDEQEEYFFEFLFADLVRGDLKTRMEAYQIGKSIGMWNPNELREKENEGPREGGDEYQDTVPGAPPNTSAPRPSVPMEPPPAGEEDTQARGVPAPLLHDVARRVGAIETRNIGRRAKGASTNLPKWRAWVASFYAGHRQRVEDELQPIAAAFTLEDWIVESVAERIERTALDALTTDGVPTGWLEQREAEIAAILEETLIAGAAVRRK